MTDRNRFLRFVYHWLREHLREPSIANIRTKLREVKRRLDALERIDAALK